MTTHSLVSRVWSFCHTLRDDGVGYGDYLEQLTFLLFLKLADEYSRPPYQKHLGIPPELSWPSLRERTGRDLDQHYRKVLASLGREPGLLGQVFLDAQNKINKPEALSRLVQLVDNEQWAMVGVDVKGEIYEGLLEKNAEDTKSGAGQYFTPRALIRTMVQCVRPQPGRTIADPACGTGGFFLAAYDYLETHYGEGMDKAQRAKLRSGTFFGNEIVPGTRRLALMNLFLHNIGEMTGTKVPISREDALAHQSDDKYDYVLANPPFGKKSSNRFTNEWGEEEREDMVYNRQDFRAITTNKQLNFLQHILTMLKTDGQAAVVLPDNVLFEGGAGETVRKWLLRDTELHTILRLPTGIFYANGVKANVLFFDNRPASKEVQTREVWYYDYRTNVHHTQKRNPMRDEHLQDFIACYSPADRSRRRETWHPETNPDGRWRKFTYDEIAARDKTSLDLTWIKDKSLTDLESLPEPDVLVDEIIENLSGALAAFRRIETELKAD